MNLSEEVSKTNIKILKINNLYLHSKYDPIKEAKRIAEKSYKPHHLHILFGYGYGYIVEELINLFQFNEPLLIIDPLVDKGLLQIKNYSYSRLYFYNSTNILGMKIMLDQLGSYTTKVQTVISMNYDKLFPLQLKAVTDAVTENINKQILNLNTVERFAHDWHLNLVLNTSHVLNDFSLESLNKKYDCPIVIASGGPSLSKQLNLLKAFREKVILICAGSTINSLLKEDIYPDYVVSIDGGDINWAHFKNLNIAKETSLIYTPTNHYKIRNVFKGDGFAFVPTSREDMKMYFQNVYNKSLPLIRGGGSVAHFALSIAKFISKGPISLIGQDLAYTDGFTHADGNKNKKPFLEQDTNVDDLYLEGYFEDKVKSNLQFQVMLNTFEEIQQQSVKDNLVFNCTEGGAKIKNMTQIAFHQFLELYSKEKIEKICLPYSSEERIDKLEVIKNEEVRYNEVLILLEQGIKLVSSCKTEIMPNKNINKLKVVDSKLNSLYKELFIEMLLEPISNRCIEQYLPQLGESEREKHIRAKKYTIDLYSSCQFEISRFLDSLKSEIKNGEA